MTWAHFKSIKFGIASDFLGYHDTNTTTEPHKDNVKCESKKKKKRNKNKTKKKKQNYKHQKTLFYEFPLSQAF